MASVSSWESQLFGLRRTLLGSPGKGSTSWPLTVRVQEAVWTPSTSLLLYRGELWTREQERFAYEHTGADGSAGVRAQVSSI